MTTIDYLSGNITEVDGDSYCHPSPDFNRKGGVDLCVNGYGVSVDISLRCYHTSVSCVRSLMSTGC